MALWRANWTFVKYALWLHSTTACILWLSRANLYAFLYFFCFQNLWIDSCYYQMINCSTSIVCESNGAHNYKVHVVWWWARDRGPAALRTNRLRQSFKVANCWTNRLHTAVLWAGWNILTQWWPHFCKSDCETDFWSSDHCATNNNTSHNVRGLIVVEQKNKRSTYCLELTGDFVMEREDRQQCTIG